MRFLVWLRRQPRDASSRFVGWSVAVAVAGVALLVLILAVTFLEAAT